MAMMACLKISGCVLQVPLAENGIEGQAEGCPVPTWVAPFDNEARLDPEILKTNNVKENSTEDVPSTNHTFRLFSPIKYQTWMQCFQEDSAILQATAGGTSYVAIEKNKTRLVWV